MYIYKDLHNVYNIYIYMTFYIMYIRCITNDRRGKYQLNNIVQIFISDIFLTIDWQVLLRKVAAEKQIISGEAAGPVICSQVI